jgi:hypothetical protein
VYLLVGNDGIKPENFWRKMYVLADWKYTLLHRRSIIDELNQSALFHKAYRPLGSVRIDAIPKRR